MLLSGYPRLRHHNVFIMYNPFLKAEISASIYTSHGGLYRRPFMRFSSTLTKSTPSHAVAVSPSQPIDPRLYSISSISLQFPVIPFDYFRSSPTKRFMSLTTRPGVLNPSHIDGVFCDLKPIQPEELMGKWNGFVLSTGHPFETELQKFNWFGHTFDSTEDVAPLVVSRNGKRVQYEEWGRASVRLLEISVRDKRKCRTLAEPIYLPATRGEIPGCRLCCADL